MKAPHRHPFAFVDRVADGSVVVRVTAGGWWTRDGSPMPLALCVEAAAQAAGELLAPAGEESPIWALAGIERATLDRPLTAGETLQVEVRLERRLGTAARVAAELRADGIRIGELLLILGAGAWPRRSRPSGRPAPAR